MVGCKGGASLAMEGDTMRRYIKPRQSLIEKMQRLVEMIFLQLATDV